MQTKDIKEIVNSKLETMIQDGTLESYIEKNLEETVLCSIKSALSSYKIREIIEEKFVAEISQELKSVSFTDYTDKVIENVCNIVKNESTKDLTRQVQNFHKNLFGERIESVSIQAIIDKYIEMMSSKKSEHYETLPDYAHVELTYNEQHYNEQHNWYKLELSTPKEEYNALVSKFQNNKKNEYHYEIMLHSFSNNAMTIFSIRGGADREEMTDRFTYRFYDDFDAFITKLYLQHTDIKISPDDCEEQEIALGDW